MSKNLNTTAGLAAEWARIKEKVTGEKAPPAPAQPDARSSLSTTSGLKAAWEHAKQSVAAKSPGSGHRQQITHQQVRTAVAELRELDPESADEIERELERLDPQD